VSASWARLCVLRLSFLRLSLPGARRQRLREQRWRRAPDGRSIVFRRGNRFLYTMRPDGSHRHLLLNAKRMGELWLWPIDWQPLPH